MGKSRKSKKGQLDTSESDKATPKSIIIYRGEVGNNVRSLMHEWRRLFMPWVSAKLHGRNSSLRDFLGIASSFSASHLQIFTSPPRGTWLRIIRFPQGPTLSFRVESFALRDDITPNQKKAAPVNGAPYNMAPIVVLNNFAPSPGQQQPSPEVDLMAKTFQSLFPTVNIHLVKPADVQRIVLFNYDPATKLVEIRHYYVLGKAVGLSKTVKKLFEGRVPSKLNSLDDIDDVISREGAWSDTDGEGEEVPLVTPFRSLKGRCRVRLIEIGPRMTLKLVKVENGFAGGETLFHDTIVKSQNQISANARRLRSRSELKATRKAEQDANVKRKREEIEEKKDSKKRKIEEREQQNQQYKFETAPVGGGGMSPVATTATGRATGGGDEYSNDNDEEENLRYSGGKYVNAGQQQQDDDDDDDDDDDSEGGDYGDDYGDDDEE